MKAAVICPTGLLDRYARTDYHLVLAHIIWASGSEPYIKYYKNRVEQGDFVILDNSVIELGRPVDASVLMGSCEILRPSELVLCDYPQDPKKTLEWAYHNGPRFKEAFPDMQLMAVPQWYPSRDADNWLDSLWHLAEHDFIDTIGIPKFLGGMRPTIIDALDKKRPDKQFHLLGTWENPAEIRAYSEYHWLRGVDSKAPVRLGQYGVALHPTRGLLANMRNAVPQMDFNYNVDPIPVVTQHNVRVFTEWAAGEEVSNFGESPVSQMR